MKKDVHFIIRLYQIRADCQEEIEEKSKEQEKNQPTKTRSSQ
jgi:hypothetical protein